MNQNEHDYLDKYPDLKELQQYQEYLKQFVAADGMNKIELSKNISDEEFYEYLRTYPNLLQLGFSNKDLRKKIADYNQYFKNGGSYEDLLKHINRFDIATLDGKLYLEMLNYAQQKFSGESNSRVSSISKVKSSGTLGSKIYASDDKAAFTSVCMLALLTFLFETVFLVVGFLLFH